jgi:hypothetical protein
MKKFIGFLGAIGLIATTTGSVVSCGAKDATTTGNLPDPFKKYDTTNKDAKTLDLGTTKATAGTPTTAEIIAGIKKAANVELDSAIKLSISEDAKTPQTGTLKITGDVKKVAKAVKQYGDDAVSKFTGEVTINVKWKLSPIAKTDLSKLAVKALGELDDAKPETIVAAINAKNADLGLAVANVEVTVNTDNTSAVVKAKDKDTKFTGSVTVTFTVKAD